MYKFIQIFSMTLYSSDAHVIEFHLCRYENKIANIYLILHIFSFLRVLAEAGRRNLLTRESGCAHQVIGETVFTVSPTSG